MNPEANEPTVESLRAEIHRLGAKNDENKDKIKSLLRDCVECKSAGSKRKGDDVETETSIDELILRTAAKVALTVNQDIEANVSIEDKYELKEIKSLIAKSYLGSLGLSASQMNDLFFQLK